MSAKGRRLFVVLLVILAVLVLAILYLSGTVEAAPTECGWNGCGGLPEVDEVCWSVTSYWPFELTEDVPPFRSVDFYSLPRVKIEQMLLSSDYYWQPVAWNGQADDTPTVTGNGYVINPYSDNWGLVAGPIETYGMDFCFHAGLCLRQHDTFGNETYQNGVFWHDGYKRYVIGVDVLTYEPLHYLECLGVIQ